MHIRLCIFRSPCQTLIAVTAVSILLAGGQSDATEVPEPPRLAQSLTPQLPDDRPVNPRFNQPLPPDRISPPPLPNQPLPPLPPPNELLPLPDAPTPGVPDLPGDVPDTIRVTRYEVLGSTVFTPEELAAITAPFTGEVSFAQLLQARSAVTQLYIDAGYITSGAYIPPQTLSEGVVTIQVIEGELEAINVTGTRRLNSSYIANRLELAAEKPLNVERLLEGLQLLQLDPLIRSISADLQAGISPGQNVLQVEVEEADSFNVTFDLDNSRSPSVGSFERGILFEQANLTGLGDNLFVAYANTDGSNRVDASYTVPLNPRNGTLQLAFGTTGSDVIEEPFDELGIEGTSRFYEITLRQPLWQSPTEEFALGITASRQESQTRLDFEGIGGFPLSPGANENGWTYISAVRLFQEWTQRSSQHVLAARSQFNLGLDVLDATVNDNAPDSRFFSWRGQGQWVRLLDEDMLLLLRADVQLADSTLVPLEQFGIGGLSSVRGYRQDTLLTDNGLQFSTEVRLPVLRVRSIDGLLQVVPFFDLGTGWNSDGTSPDESTLTGMGLGLLWSMNDNFSARIDFAFPLVDIEFDGDTWQEDGIYFTVQYTPF